MYEVLEILVFKSPFDTQGDFLKKQMMLTTMFEDYAVATEGKIFSSEEQKGAVVFDSKKIQYTGVSMELQLAIKKELSPVRKDISPKELNHSVAPMIIFSVHMRAGAFDKQAVESLLDDTIRFFSGVFPGEYFADVDSQYTISRMNEGKKYQESDLVAYDFEKHDSAQNKRMYDALLYLRYGLTKNMKQLQSELQKSEDVSSSSEAFQSHLETTKERSILSIESIKRQLQIMDDQIIFVTNAFAS